jgi:formate dehydrogenase assembly factor FdhD
VNRLKHLFSGGGMFQNSENIVIVELAEGFVPELMKADRNFYTTSSCGVCGKGSIESIRTVSTFHNHTKNNKEVSWKLCISYPKNCSLSRIISVLQVVFTLPASLIWKESSGTA